MKFLELTVSAALFIAGTQAAPAKQGFSIRQVPNPNYQPNGRATLLKMLEKHGNHKRAAAVRAHAESATRLHASSVSSLPATSSASSEPHGTASTGSVVATPQPQDNEYLCNVEIGGSKPTTFKMILDTGSSDLWVASNGLPQSEQKGKKLYDASPANLIANSKWNISYADGSGASGKVYRDTVNIGGVTVTSQGVEAATSMAAEFSKGGEDGLVGLGFPQQNTAQPQQKTFFENAVDQGLPKNLFAVELKHQKPGSYDFGFIDSKKHTGEIAYTDVDTSTGHWTFTPTGYSIGNGSMVKGSYPGTADTGTVLIELNYEMVEAYYKQVPHAQDDQGAGGYVFPCSSQLPDLTLQIGDYKAVVPGKFLNHAPVTEGNQTCMGGLQKSSNPKKNIYGEVFLKSQYVVYDQTQEKPRLGFAPQADL